MRIFLAAVYTTGIHLKSVYTTRMSPVEWECRFHVPNILESYHYVHKEQRVKEMRRDGVKVFLDSGAFSAMTQGVEIDLEGYCRYIHDNRDIVEVASVLDGIGDPQKTYENQCAMEDAGTAPLPCFHYGEDERYLEYYVEKYQYITLGGMVPIAKPSLRVWLDRIWGKYLTDAQGRARIKVHGFGLTSLSLMSRYPWYSVDSSSWQAYGSMGNILLPEYGPVPVSDTSPSRRQRDRHLTTVPAVRRAVIEQEAADRGFDMQRLERYYFSRWAFNMRAFYEIQNTLTERAVRFKDAQPSIFEQHSSPGLC